MEVTVTVSGRNYSIFVLNIMLKFCGDLWLIMKVGAWVDGQRQASEHRILAIDLKYNTQNDSRKGETRDIRYRFSCRSCIIFRTTFHY